MTFKTLHAGAARCLPTYQLSIRPVQAVIELGAVADVIHAALNAAHHANRHNSPDDRIAVALPGLGERRGVAVPGHEVVLFGPDKALHTFVQLDGIKTLVRRGMVRELEIRETFSSSGEPGTAFARDRTAAKHSRGALRRSRERAARRGIKLPDQTGVSAQLVKIAAKQAGSGPLLALYYGSAVVHVRPVERQQTTGPLMVSTYGLSSPEAPAVLPIRLDRATGWLDDAA